MQVINIFFYFLINLCPEYFGRYYRQGTLPLKILTAGQKNYDEKIPVVAGYFAHV